MTPASSQAASDRPTAAVTGAYVSLRAHERTVVVTQSGAELGAAMRLRSHRRDVVVWSPSGASAGRYSTPRFTRPGRARRIRRCVRIGALLTVIGLVRLAQAVRPRWRPLLAGGVLTVVGVTLRSGAGGLVVIPGLMFLLYAPLIETGACTGRTPRAELRRELGRYTTPAQRRDLEATLDRYPDSITCELRDILARQAGAARHGGIPGAGRY
jgi:hypothetical protein